MVLTGAGTAMTDSVQQLQSVATGMQAALTTVGGDVRDSAGMLKDSAVEVTAKSADALHIYHNDLRNAYIDLRNLSANRSSKWNARRLTS